MNPVNINYQPSRLKSYDPDLQARAVTYGTHIHLGQYTLPTATRADRLSGVVVSPVPVFWNIEKK